MAGSPFCTSSAYPLGAYRIPLGTGLLIPSRLQNAVARRDMYRDRTALAWRRSDLHVSAKTLRSSLHTGDPRAAIPAGRPLVRIQPTAIVLDIQSDFPIQYFQFRQDLGAVRMTGDVMDALFEY